MAACVAFDQASGSMAPIMIPEVFTSKVQQKSLGHFSVSIGSVNSFDRSFV